MNDVRLGIVGLGNMGLTHMRNIRSGVVPGLKVAALCDSTGKAKDLVQGDELDFVSHSDMIRSGAVDAVLIATPHYFHTVIGVEALEAGLHILVEKPLAVHKADAETLINAARQRPGQVFAGMYNQRTDPLYRKIKDLVVSGELGAVRRILWDITAWFRTEFYFASGGWRATWKGEGGGVLINQCLHNLDIFQWIFGMPESVHAFCQFGRYHQIEVEDDVTAFLRYPDGSHATIITSTGESPGRNHLVVAGENGLLSVDVPARKIHFRRNRVPTTRFSEETMTAFGQPETWECEIPVDSAPPSQHVEILRDFAQAVLQKRDPFAPAEEGLHSVELANAMLLSTWENRTISLPMDGAAFAARLNHLAETSTFQKKVMDPARSAVSSEDFSKSFR
jgi:predicted dehydrogenase